MLTCKKARCGYLYGAIRPLVLILYGWLGNSRIEPSAWQSATAVQSSHKDTPQCVIPERSKELFIARVASGSHCTVLLTFRKPDEALFVSDPGLINPDADIKVPPYRSDLHALCTCNWKLRNVWRKLINFVPAMRNWAKIHAIDRVMFIGFRDAMTTAARLCSSRDRRNIS